MKELLESVSKLARKYGFIVFYRKIDSAGNEQKEKADIKVLFDRVLDSYYDSQK